MCCPTARCPKSLLSTVCRSSRRPPRPTPAPTSCVFLRRRPRWPAAERCAVAPPTHTGRMTQALVRPASPTDADAVAAVQHAAWVSSYTGVLPPQVLSALTPEGLRENWQRSLAAPPSARHRALVA